MSVDLALTPIFRSLLFSSEQVDLWSELISRDFPACCEAIFANRKFDKSAPQAVARASGRLSS